MDLAVADLRPVLDHLIVRPDTVVEQVGGILIPENARRRPAKGRVLAAGPGRRTDRGVLIPMVVQIGDLVYYNAHTGVEVDLDQETVLVMRDEDVLAVEN